MVVLSLLVVITLRAIVIVVALRLVVLPSVLLVLSPVFLGIVALGLRLTHRIPELLLLVLLGLGEMLFLQEYL